MFERYSALNGVSRDARMGESRGWILLQAAAFAGTHAEFRSSVRSLLGVDLPTTVGDVARINGRQLLKTGAEQYWIITGDDDDTLEADLRGAVPAAMGAITNLSHSRTCMFIEGGAARVILAKGVPLDFHPDHFRVDQFALTGLHHTPVLIHRSADNRFELYALRTYALCVWEWLTDAATPLLSL